MGGAGLGVYNTHRFVVLAHDFAVSTDDEAFGRYLDRILEPFAHTGPAATRYRFLEHGPTEAGSFELRYEGAMLACGSDPAEVFGHLLWHINRQVITTSRRWLLFHAAAAELDGRVVVLPADSESGKSTLVAGLVRAGLRYVTDEVVAIDLETGLVEPVPMAINLKSGSWDVLAALAPAVEPELARYGGDRWVLDVRIIRDDVLAPATAPVLIVSPTYRPESTTRLVPLRPAEAAVLLGTHCFNLADTGRAGFETLLTVARRSPAYRMDVGHLGLACDAIIGLLAETPVEAEDRPSVTGSEVASAGSRPSRPRRGPCRRDDLGIASFDGETVIYDLTDASAHVLNRSGALVWELLDGNTTLDELASEVATVFDTDLEVVRGDVRHIVTELERKGLLLEPATIESAVAVS